DETRLLLETMYPRPGMENQLGDQMRVRRRRKPNSLDTESGQRIGPAGPRGKRDAEVFCRYLRKRQRVLLHAPAWNHGDGSELLAVVTGLQRLTALASGLELRQRIKRALHRQRQRVDRLWLGK